VPAGKTNITIGRCLLTAVTALTLAALLSGCGQNWTTGYSGETLYPDNVSTVYVEMFDSTSLRRGHEYDLTDAVAKRIEAETPYKIVSDRNTADTVLSGRVDKIGLAILTGERQTGRPLEKQFQITAVVNWKNVRTGKLFINQKSAAGAVSYSTFQQQGIAYASAQAANHLAERIVEMMQNPW